MASGLVFAIALAGCGRQHPETPPASRPTTTVQAAGTTASPAHWKAALAATHQAHDASDRRRSGVTRFLATFPGGPEGSPLVAFALHDAFRKLWLFHAGPPVRSRTGVHAYVSVPELGRPLLFLQPVYRAEGDFIMLQKVSVLADGELVLDLPCARVRRQVARDTIAEEYCDLPLSVTELGALRRIRSAGEVIVRLTGQDGYVHLEPGADPRSDPLALFRRDTASALVYFDALAAALEPHVTSRQRMSAGLTDPASLTTPESW